MRCAHRLSRQSSSPNSTPGKRKSAQASWPISTPWKAAIDETAAEREVYLPYQLRLILSSFVEPHFLQTSVRSSNSPLNSIGVIRMMTISVPQTGHVEE